jgi:hypothetical protein
MNTLKNPAITGLVWLVARLWLGYEWMHAGIEKVFGDGNVACVGEKAGAGVTGFLKVAIAKSPLGDGFDPSKTPTLPSPNGTPRSPRTCFHPERSDHELYGGLWRATGGGGVDEPEHAHSSLLQAPQQCTHAVDDRSHVPADR